MMYRCPIYMEHTRALVDKISQTSYVALAIELASALRQDQHDLFHDAEFVDGCDICDQERAEHG